MSEASYKSLEPKHRRLLENPKLGFDKTKSNKYIFCSISYLMKCNSSSLKVLDKVENIYNIF